MKKRPFLRAAQRFHIYREGEAVRWQCSYADLARAAGIDATEVSKVCHSPIFRKNGWFPRGDRADPHNLFGQQRDVDALMRLDADSQVRTVYDY